MYITGISFAEKHLQQIVDQHCVSAGPKKLVTKPAAQQAAVEASAKPDVTPASGRTRKADAASLPAGALLATGNQAMAALGVGRTKLYELMNDGRLVRREIGRGVRLEVASTRALAGPDA